VLEMGLILCPPGRCLEGDNFLLLPVIKHELFRRPARNLVIKVINIEETAVFTVDFKIIQF